MKLAKITAALGFAHLLGLPAAAARAEEDDDKKQRPDESGEDYAKRMEGDDKDGDEKDEKGAKKAEGGDDDAGDGDDQSKAKGKAEGDNEDEEGEEDDKEKAARKSERARCAAIFASPAAGVRPDMAAHLAFNTDLSAKAAVEMLGAFAAGAAQPSNLASRMSGVKTPNVGASAPAAKQATGAAAAANMIIEAGKKRRGEA
jgi:hypothetical protein